MSCLLVTNASSDVRTLVYSVSVTVSVKCVMLAWLWKINNAGKWPWKQLRSNNRRHSASTLTNASSVVRTLVHVYEQWITSCSTDFVTVCRPVGCHNVSFSIDFRLFLSRRNRRNAAQSYLYAITVQRKGSLTYQQMTGRKQHIRKY